MQTIRLSLLLLLGLPGALLASDVGYFGVIKSQQYEQTPATAPTIISNGYAFNAFVIANTNGVLTNATVRQSNTGATHALAPETNDMAWRFEERFNTQAALDAAYPAGSATMISPPVKYTMTMSTANDGVRSADLNFYLVQTPLPIPLSYPSTPQISNLAAGQAIDTTTDFTLRWNALGAGILDIYIVQVTVLDMASNVVFASPVPFQSNALSGASTSIVIPANTLPPGTNLQAHLSVAKATIPNTNYAVGVTALAKDTAFALATRPAPAAPWLEVLPASGGQFRLQFPAEADRHYHLQATTDWTSWADLLVTNPPAGKVIYTDADSPLLRQRFFRVQVGP